MQAINRRALPLLTAILAAALFAAACEDTGDDTGILDGDGDANGAAASPASTEGIDREAILNEVEEVQAMLEEAASDIPADAVSDVSFDNSTLTVTVTEEISGLDQAEQLCEDLSQAVQATDIQILVQDASGGVMAECAFEQ